VVLTLIIKMTEVLVRSTLNTRKMSTLRTTICVICLTETWILDLCFDHKIFLDCYTVVRSDRVTTNKTRDGGLLNVLSSRVRFYKRRYDVKPCNECAWVEIPTVEVLNLLSGDNYIPLYTEPETLVNYFRVL
jgi:hypothetical protein